MDRRLILVATLTLCLAGPATALTTAVKPPTKGVRFPAVYLDMDGTSLGDDGRVRPATKAALERYRACGGRVGVATGRSWEQASPHFADLGPDLPVVVFNGAVTMAPDGSRVIEARRLPADAVEVVRGLAKARRDVRATVLHGIRSSIADRLNDDVRWFFERSLLTPPTVDAALVGPEGALPIQAVLLTTKKAGPKLRTHVEKTLGPELLKTLDVIITSRGRAVRIVPKNSLKSPPVKRALEAAGIDPRAVVAFGDASNDVDFIREAGVGIAMGNCHESTCAVALLRIGTHDTDALADTIERLLIDPACEVPSVVR